MISDVVGKFKEDHPDLKDATYDEALSRYIASFKGDYNKLRKAVIENIDTISKDDFLKYIEETVRENREAEKEIKELREKGNDSLADAIKSGIHEVSYDFKTAFQFLATDLFEVIVGLVRNGVEDITVLGDAWSYIEAKAATWYAKPADYQKAKKAVPTTAMAEVDYKGGKKLLNGGLRYTTGDVEMITEAIKDAPSSLSVNTDKLLKRSIIEFTTGGHDNATVTIPLLDYAASLGFQVYNADPKKANEARKRARISIKNDIKRLLGVVLTWEDQSGKNFAGIHYWSSAFIRNNQIYVNFDPFFAAYLNQNSAIIQYPTELFRIDAKDPTTYKIGYKLADNYNNDTKQDQGTHDVLSAKTLHRVSGLPTYDEVLKSSNRSWRARILEPIEESLDKLTDKYNYLKEWHWVKSNHEELTPDELEIMRKDFDFWHENCLVCYTPWVIIDHTERRERKAEKRKNNSKKQ